MIDKNVEEKPSQITETLWWFSTAIKKLIINCTIDKNRYQIIGAAVMFTWLYATLAWTYFWSTNSHSPFIYILLGIFMGAFVLAIDRVLISSINKNKINLWAIGLRVIMALAIGTFLAQPIILFIFSSDINREVPLLIDKKKAEKKLEISTIYENRKQELINNEKKIENEINAKQTDAANAQQEYLKEIDGTGGSGNYGIAGIAAQKQKAFNLKNTESEKLKQDKAPELINIKTELDSINLKINTDFNNYQNAVTADGYLIKKEALQSLFLKDKTGALNQQYYLLMLILTLFELIPIISKLFLSTGAYDKKLLLQDEMESEMADQSNKNEMEIKQYFNDQTKQNDIKTIDEMFEKIKEEKNIKLDGLIKKWNENEINSFDGFWKKTKNEILSKQEN